MDARQCMIVDLERKGDRQKFITEQVASIKRNENGYWAVRFITSPRVFQYNPARLLCLTPVSYTHLDVYKRQLLLHH